MKTIPMSKLGKIILLLLVLSCSRAEETEQADGEIQADMTIERLDTLIRRIDEDAQREQNQWLFSYGAIQVLVVTDTNADRMRVMAPVTEAKTLDEEHLYRLMQANFESALDARYAIAKGTVWSTFIHPLSPLSDEQFFSGIGQTLNLVVTFGESYSSGALVFGGGDKPDAPQTPYDDIMRRGEST